MSIKRHFLAAAAATLAFGVMSNASYAATLDFTDPAFATSFDGNYASVMVDGVTFTITPSSGGSDGFRQNASGLGFGVPGNGMTAIAIVADQDVIFQSMSGFDNSIQANTTPMLFNAIISNRTSVFSDVSLTRTLSDFDFADATVEEGYSFFVQVNSDPRIGFNPVFAQATISSLEFSTVQVSAVPLPAGLPLLMAGIGAFGLVRRRK